MQVRTFISSQYVGVLVCSERSNVEQQVKKLILKKKNDCWCSSFLFIDLLKLKFLILCLYGYVCVYVCVYDFFSEVDLTLLGEDRDRFPLSASSLCTYSETVLRAGEMLFIPRFVYLISFVYFSYLLEFCDTYYM